MTYVEGLQRQDMIIIFVDNRKEIICIIPNIAIFFFVLAKGKIEIVFVKWIHTLFTW